MKNWKTTILGVTTILGAVLNVVRCLIDGDPSTNADWASTAAAITAGWGLIHAADASKSQV